jgi:hypothetical protein
MDGAQNWDQIGTGSGWFDEQLLQATRMMRDRAGRTLPTK